MNTPNRPHDHDPLFDRLESPQPTSELRDRVLGAGIEALQGEPVADLWERLWHSRALRLAWGASVLALMAGHLAMGGANGAPPETVSSVHRTADADLASIVELLRIGRPAVHDFGWIDQLNGVTNMGDGS
jgi:hypothetical protein